MYSILSIKLYPHYLEIRFGSLEVAIITLFSLYAYAVETDFVYRTLFRSVSEWMPDMMLRYWCSNSGHRDY